MKSSTLWSRLSLAGVTPALDNQFARKIVLSNQIALSTVIVGVLASISHLLLGSNTLAVIIFLLAPLYLLTPYANHRQHYFASRAFLMFFPLLVVVLAAGLVVHGDNSMQFALISVILIPVLVFGVTEFKRMALGIGAVVLVFLTMDITTAWLPQLQGLDPASAGSTMNIKVNGVISFAMFSAAFVYLQRLNLAAEARLSDMLDTVHAQKAIIEARNKVEKEHAEALLTRQMEINKMKTTFVAMTSHEFRTPLTSILSSEELLRDFGDRLAPAERAELFAIIEASVMRMTSMLDKMLFIGQSDADLLEFRPTKMNLHNLCQQILEDAHTLARSTSTVTLRMSYLRSDEFAWADETLIRQCLGNLLSNAIKYSPHGGEVSLRIADHTTGIEFEAGLRHAEIVINDLGLKDSTSTKSPGVKEHGDDKHRMGDKNGGLRGL